MLEILIVAISSYLLGSIPFGLVLTKLAKKGDIRKQGSGNIGATNAWRTAGPLIGIPTFVLDVSKGAIAALLTKHFFGLEWLMALSGAMAVIGHIFPIWLKNFIGGKGVATTLAVILVIDSVLGSVFIGAWLLFFIWKRLISLSSITAAFVTMVASVFLASQSVMIMTIVVCFLILIRHKDNMKRLKKGEEKPIF